MDFEEWAKGFMEKLRPAAEEGAQERQPKVPKYVSLHNVVGVCGVCGVRGLPTRGVRARAGRCLRPTTRTCPVPASLCRLCLSRRLAWRRQCLHRLATRFRAKS